MGRYWSATTNNGYTFEGKFWFAIQNSDDFENVGFVRSSMEKFYYSVCCCSILTDEPENITDWCEDCYNTRDEYYEAMKENMENRAFYYNGNESIYDYEVDYDDLLERLDTAEMKNISKHLLNFNAKITDLNSIEIDYEVSSSNDNELLAKYVSIKIVKNVIDLTGCKSIKVHEYI